MSYDLDRYRSSVQPLETDGIDFDRFEVEPLCPAALRSLRYMHDVEHHTACYLRNLLNTRAHHDPETTAFLTLWNYEEYWHGEALARVLAAHGEDAGDVRVARMRRRLGWRDTASPVAWMAFSAVNPHFLALHMTIGAVNEWTTQAGYSRLIAVADHPVLTDLLGRIMRQEGRHIDYYATRATDLLAASGWARRVTRAAVQILWKPVGAGAMPAAELDHLARSLFSGPDGVAVLDRIDRRVDRLPGLAGLGLLRRALARHQTVTPAGERAFPRAPRPSLVIA